MLSFNQCDVDLKKMFWATQWVEVLWESSSLLCWCWNPACVADIYKPRWSEHVQRRKHPAAWRRWNQLIRKLFSSSQDANPWALVFISGLISCLTLFYSRVVRKSIARVLTVINQTQKENLRKFYKVRATSLVSAHWIHTQSRWLGTFSFSSLRWYLLSWCFADCQQLLTKRLRLEITVPKPWSQWLLWYLVIVAAASEHF